MQGRRESKVIRSGHRLECTKSLGKLLSVALSPRTHHRESQMRIIRQLLCSTFAIKKPLLFCSEKANLSLVRASCNGLASAQVTMTLSTIVSQFGSLSSRQIQQRRSTSLHQTAYYVAAILYKLAGLSRCAILHRFLMR